MSDELEPVILLPEAEIKDLMLQRKHLYAQIRGLEDEAKAIGKKLGLDEMRHHGHIPGTNMEEWRCLRCDGVFAGVVKGLCPVCRPFKEDADGR